MSNTARSWNAGQVGLRIANGAWNTAIKSGTFYNWMKRLCKRGCAALPAAPAAISRWDRMLSGSIFRRRIPHPRQPFLCANRSLLVWKHNRKLSGSFQGGKTPVRAISREPPDALPGECEKAAEILHFCFLFNAFSNNNDPSNHTEEI